ncbi:MAG: GNAT family N-acetyltransferase, partial [Thermodesulfobacteriota bacterium]
MNLQVVNPIDIPNWDSLVLSRPDYSFFHSSAWARVLSDAYGYKPVYFSVLDDDRLRAMLPVMEVNSLITGKRGVSLPFTDYCDPMIDEGFEFQMLVDQVINCGKKAGWKYLELRGGRPFLGNAVSSASYLGHTLDLTEGAERLFPRFRDSTQRNIKKAEREGVKTTLSSSMDAVRAFCRLNSITRKRHGLPTQPLGFFKAIYRHAISKGLGFVVLASLGPDIIAGSIFFLFGRKALFKYGASVLERQRFRSNNLVMWEAIKWLSEKGFESLSFGRTEPEHAGLLQFKAGWRPIERQIAYYRCNIKKGLFVNGSPASSRAQHVFFGKMPIPVLN